MLQHMGHGTPLTVERHSRIRPALPRARVLGSHAAPPPSAVASRLGARRRPLLRHQRTCAQRTGKQAR